MEFNDWTICVSRTLYTGLYASLYAIILVENLSELKVNCAVCLNKFFNYAIEL